MNFCTQPVVKRYMALVHWFIPEHLRQSPLQLSRAHNVVSAALIAGVACPSYALLYHSLQFDQGMYAVLLAGLGMISLPLLLKATGQLSPCRDLFVCCIYVLMAWLTYYLGGISAPTVPWFLLCPLVAMLLGGPKPGIVWGSISSCTMLGIYFAYRTGLHFPPSPIRNIAFLQTFCMVGLSIITVIFLLFFEAAKSQGFMKLEKALRIIQELAIRDELTGIYNRRHLLKLIEDEKQHADRYGPSFCLCLLDVDHFKRINDTYGHAAGDNVLQTLAKTLQDEIRVTDCFGRYGGEEFLLLLPNTGVEDAGALIDRIRKKIEWMSLPLAEKVNMTVSAGITDYRPQENISQTIDRADKALYQAKATGRNQVIRTEAIEGV